MNDRAVAHEAVFARIAKELPVDLRRHCLLVGSLAAAYHFRLQLRQPIHTKDADLVVQPAGASSKCRRIAESLLATGWRRTRDCEPHASPDPTDRLRAIRLHPPDHDSYFIEILGFPERGQHELLRWAPCRLPDGWYGIPCFRYLSLTGHAPITSDSGLRYAAPAAMALANLLSHPEIGSVTIGGPISGRSGVLRSARDLGRVLGLAFLSSRDEVESWADDWADALRKTFPKERAALAALAGQGLRALLQHPRALDDARHVLEVGLLRGQRMTTERLAAIARQVLSDAVDRLSGLVGPLRRR